MGKCVYLVLYGGLKQWEYCIYNQLLLIYSWDLICFHVSCNIIAPILDLCIFDFVVKKMQHPSEGPPLAPNHYTKYFHTHFIFLVLLQRKYNILKFAELYALLAPSLYIVWQYFLTHFIFFAFVVEKIQYSEFFWILHLPHTQLLNCLTKYSWHNFIFLGFVVEKV